MKIKSLLLSLSITLFLSCNTNQKREIEHFSAEKPYAVEVAKERSYYQAEKLSDRLYTMGLDAYVVQNVEGDHKEKVDWYYILCGSLPSLDSAAAVRNTIEQKFGIKSKDLKIATYSNYSNPEINIDSLKLVESKRVNRKKPDVKNDVLSVLEKFPESEMLFVQSATVINTPDVDNKGGFSHVSSMYLDLPRGFKRSHILKHTTAFTEVIYKDNLYGDRVTIEIGKLRKRNDVQSLSILTASNQKTFEIAEEFADLILDTDEYRFEEKKEIEIDSYRKLYGYKVTIETKRDHFRTYIVLVDERNEYLLFSQSTDKSEKELISILEDIGKGEGAFDYDEFYNTFNTIPDKIIDGDRFIGFTLSKLTWQYAINKNYTDWSKAYVGHWAANGYFYNEKKGVWSYGLFDILNSEKAKYIENMYEGSIKTETTSVSGVTGHVIYDKKFNRRTWRYYTYVKEINFTIGRYCAMVDNTGYSWLNKQELKERAESIQFKEVEESPAI